MRSESAPQGPEAPPDTPQPAPDEPFKKLVTNVKLVGNFTLDGHKPGTLQREEYLITGAKKLGEGDSWALTSGIKYGDVDLAVPGRAFVRRHWAGRGRRKVNGMVKRRKRRRDLPSAADQEAVYICDSCGEEIVVPVDISAGTHQDYVEDCPVCCHPMRLRVEIGDDGEAHVEGEHE
jgi:hypothetical protein